MSVLLRLLGCFLNRFATDVMFQPGNGDRSGVLNYLVILSDGNSDNATATWREAMRARARGINIITVSSKQFLISPAVVLSCWTYSCFFSPGATVYQRQLSCYLSGVD